VKKEIVISKF